MRRLPELRVGRVYLQFDAPVARLVEVDVRGSEASLGVDANVIMPRAIGMNVRHLSSMLASRAGTRDTTSASNRGRASAPCSS